MERYPDVQKMLKNKAIKSLPMVAFNGIPLWTGSLSYYYLVEELSKRGFEPVA